MINLGEYNLYEYDFNNVSHKTTIINLYNDLDTYKYMGNIDVMVDSIKMDKIIEPLNEVYIIENNNNYIGIITLSLITNKYQICYAILPEYRNKLHASKLLKLFTEYIFNNTSLDDLYLFINPNNYKSKKIALNNGYKKCGLLEYNKKRID